MRRHGFTLIELLIVVAIIAILAAIALPNFLEAQTRAKVSRAQSDLRLLSIGIEQYRIDNTNYPYSETVNGTSWMPAGGGPKFAPPDAKPGGLTSPIAYLTALPLDPFSHEILDANGAPTGLRAPLYFERAGFHYQDGVKGMKPVVVPADSVGIVNAMTGTGPDTLEGDMFRTPKRWILSSVGPDLKQDLVGPDGSTISRSRYNLNNRYDPTNGTVSAGNILRGPGGESIP